MMIRTRFVLLGAAAAILGTPATTHAQTQLILDGYFVTAPALNGTTYSSTVGRQNYNGAGSGETPGATATLTNTTGTAGWMTTEADGLFEVWTPGEQGSPTTAGNTLELANNAGGDTIYQNVASIAGGAGLAVFSFGYADRNTGADAFKVTITDETNLTTLFSQAFNPTGSFATNQTFSMNLTLRPGDTYQVAFLDQNTAGTGGTAGTQSAHIDMVSLIQTVPEASSLGYLLLGAASLVLVRRVQTRPRRTLANTISQF